MGQATLAVFGREISRRVGLSASTCHEALKNLHDRGVVLFRRVSNVHLYQINPDNFLVNMVYAPFFKAEEEVPKKLLELITHTLTKGPRADRIVSLILFGSRARGTASLNSDLDLMLLVPDKPSLKAVEPDIDKLRQLLAQKFSISLSPYLQTLAELKHKHAEKLPLISEILKEGQRLYGKELKELLS